jgi:O-antigen biosynthesis protein WbqV
MTPLSQLTGRSLAPDRPQLLGHRACAARKLLPALRGGDAFYARVRLLLLKVLPFFVVFSIVSCYVFNLTTTEMAFVVDHGVYPAQSVRAHAER